MLSIATLFGVKGVAYREQNNLEVVKNSITLFALRGYAQYG